MQAAGDLLSTAVAGVLYTTVSPAAAFAYAGSWMLLSLAASATLRPPRSARGADLAR
ncbi:MAG TPA: hypothetical protein VMB05_04890 [Solirubrobacteraceae bacterium]|nr:hypothetical protein [Solirubrobacteraceae bacterium]